MISVTQAIKRYSSYHNVDPYVLEAASVRGSDVHRICAAYAQKLWIPSIPEEYKLRVQSFTLWFDEVVEKVIAVEEEFHCHCHHYIGHPDLVLIIKGDAKATVVDIKTPTTQSRAWRAQLAGYWHLVNHKMPVKRCGTLMLDPNGKQARLVEYTNSPKDFNGFLNALQAERFFSQ